METEREFCVGIGPNAAAEKVNGTGELQVTRTARNGNGICVYFDGLLVIVMGL